MRALLLALMLATPAQAWQATVGAICTLSHDTEAANIFLTYDPAKPLYSLTITLAQDSWAPSLWFAMRFDGPTPIEIATSRHTLSGDATALSTADTGFGNVLDGLEFNDTAVALTQNRILQFPLDGAAPEVRTFRACAPAQLS
ncbi:hypothetical protein [Shimia sp.]|uniref:hypothetical protein n=1 Tax=Shimia sp. TaxID=1954381 RepID=UPI00329A7144